MPDLEELIQRHKSRGVLVDSNLLVLYLVGATNPKRIQSFKRTQRYTIEQFEILQRLIACFSSVIATPHVLTEVSNLTDLDGRERLLIRELFRRHVLVMDERFVKSQTVVQDALFDRLGLTDSAIASLHEEDVLVVTDDLHLHLALERRGVDSLNFNHVLALEWA
jgi:hypothetical protein